MPSVGSQPGVVGGLHGRRGPRPRRAGCRHASVRPVGRRPQRRRDRHRRRQERRAQRRRLGRLQHARHEHQRHQPRHHGLHRRGEGQLHRHHHRRRPGRQDVQHRLELPGPQLPVAGAPGTVVAEPGAHVHRQQRGAPVLAGLLHRRRHAVEPHLQPGRQDLSVGLRLPEAGRLLLRLRLRPPVPGQRLGRQRHGHRWRAEGLEPRRRELVAPEHRQREQRVLGELQDRARRRHLRCAAGVRRRVADDRRLQQHPSGAVRRPDTVGHRPADRRCTA